MAKENPPQPINADVLLQYLKKSGLLSETDFQKIATLADRKSERSKVSKIIQGCKDSQILSQWQIDQLLKGKYKGFFLGKFKLIDVLGAGGMSAVFLAEHTLSGQQRAIKILPRKNLNERSYLTRFYREGRAVAALNHPNIIRIYDIANDGQTHYMVMEFVQGSDLYELVKKQGPLNFEMCRQIIRQATQGIGHAHQNHLIHRDIKPANLFLTRSNSVKILDLGLALLKTDGAQFGLSAQHNEKMMGTADYLAPEQAINSNAIDHRVDIYSLGCTLYFLLTGQPPFPTGTLAQRIASHQYNQPRNIQHFRGDCPEQLIQICDKMMSKAPDDRFQDCHELAIALSGESLPDIQARQTRSQEVHPKRSQHRIKKKNRGSNLPALVLIAGLAFVVVILIVVLLNRAT